MGVRLATVRQTNPTWRRGHLHADLSPYVGNFGFDLEAAEPRPRTADLALVRIEAVDVAAPGAGWP